MGYPSGVFKGPFAPAFAVGDNLLLTPRSQVSREEKSNTIRRVIFVEQIPEITIDLVTASGQSSVAAAASQLDIQVTDLEMDNNELAQFRFVVLDTGAEVELKQPLGKTRFKTKNEIARISTSTRESKTEFYEFEDTALHFNLYNRGATAIEKACLRFSGWRGVLDERQWTVRDLIEELANRAYEEITGPGSTRDEALAYRYKGLVANSRDEGFVLGVMLRDGTIKHTAIPTEGLG
jgi:hypothetical protein